jgi:uncharacterized membrane protein YdjX (TVP38/TMEM64 family)
MLARSKREEVAMRGVPKTARPPTQPPAQAGESPAHTTRRAALWLISALALVGLVVFGGQLGDAVEQSLPQLRAWLAGLGIAGPLLFILIYGGAAVAGIPGSALTILAGTLFGLGAGTLIAWLGASFGALLAFLVARHIARERIETRLADNPRLEAIDRAVGENGLRIVFLLRLSPAFPYVLLNYLLGLTRVGFAHYNLASFGMLPATFLYVYLGHVGGEAAHAVAGGGPSAARWAFWILGLLATIAVTALVTRIAKRALNERVAGERSPSS